jgi:hypothetical protein
VGLSTNPSVTPSELLLYVHSTVEPFLLPADWLLTSAASAEEEEQAEADANAAATANINGQFLMPIQHHSLVHVCY